MQIIVSEKAIAGESIASILAGKKVAMSKLDSAQILEFKKGSEDFAVIPLRGHIVDVDFPKQYSSWLGTDLKQLAIAPIEYIPTEKGIAALLKKFAPRAEAVIVATDADREGESIGVEALRLMQSTNPKIKISRAYFSAITKRDIEDAFSKLTKVDYNFADSAYARREVDLIWGAVLTRFLSLISGRLGKEFLSVGRVQTPVLALIVDREKERLAFKQQKYWVLAAIFEKDKQQFEAEHKKGKFWEKSEAEAILNKKNATGIVTKVQSAERTLAKPVPFNTTEFLRAATVLGLTAGEAMQHAEALYQHGLTSYPRTDNSTYPPNLNLKEILNELLKVSDFAPMVEKIFSLGTLSPSKGKESKDHPPIHPVAAASKSQMPERQWRVYELICRRFFATLSEDAITFNQRIEIEMNKEPFLAHGQLIKKIGWKEFYPYSTIKEVRLPKLEKGDTVKLIKLDMLEKETQPPARYSQSSLIKLMEDLGLGTKSTRHEIIQKLYNRRYILGLKSIEPHKIAFAVIDSLQKSCKTVTEPKMTADLEREMDEIAAGKIKKDSVVSGSRQALSEILEVLLKDKNEIGSSIRKAFVEDSIVGKCANPACDGQLMIRKGHKTGKRFLGCSKYPQCTTSYPLPQLGRIVVLNKECPECKAPMIKIEGKRSRFEMCINHNCKTKDEWKKKRQAAEAAAAAAQAEKPVVQEKAPVEPAKPVAKAKEVPVKAKKAVAKKAAKPKREKKAKGKN